MSGRCEIWFQSHAGSIEAPRGGSLRFGHQPRFNPTLVRLRRWRAGRRPSGAAAFQSHAGSIEAARCFRCGVAAHPFQSHAGSIEAGEAVALELDDVELFQSHAGSIEA